MDFIIESRAPSIRDGGTINSSCSYSANIGGGGAVMRNAYYTHGLSYGGSSCSSTTTTNSSSSSSDLGFHSKTEDSLEGAQCQDDHSFYQNNSNLLKLAYTHNHHHDTEMISANNNIYLNYNTSNQNQNQNNHHNHNCNFNDMGGGLGFPPFKSSPVSNQLYLPGGCGWQYSKNHLINPSFEYNNAATGKSFSSSSSSNIKNQHLFFGFFPID